MNGGLTGTNQLPFHVARVYPEWVPSESSPSDLTEGQGQKREACVTARDQALSGCTCKELVKECAELVTQ